mgnify:CR=1 FL=1
MIAITNRDLKIEMANGNFREDLYYRLCVVPIIVPALKSRPEDIPGLIEHFMEIAAASAGLPKREMGGDAMACLQSYDWPGNLRQLRNVVDWILIMANETAEEMISAESLPPEIGSETPAYIRWDEGGEVMGLSIREAREVFERQYLKNQNFLSLQISYNHLFQMLDNRQLFHQQNQRYIHNQSTLPLLCPLLLPHPYLFH